MKLRGMRRWNFGEVVGGESVRGRNVALIYLLKPIAVDDIYVNKMISTAKVSPDGLGHYHSREDAEEKPGHWLGKGAKSIGLSGEVKIDDLVSVAHGKAPNGIRLKAKRSVYRHGEYRNAHKAGTDAVFSPPKSASILGLVAEDKRVIEAHKHAALDVLDEIEQTCAIATVRTGGVRRSEDTKNVIVAAFDHTTTRPNKQGFVSPQLHTHSIIFGSTKCSDGKWRSLENKRFFRDEKTRLRKMYISGVGERLKTLGYGINYERDGLHFTIDGISLQQEQAYSGRVKDIETELPVPRGEASYKQLRYANLKTRSDKDGRTLPELQKEWREIAVEKGLDFDRVPGFKETPESIPLPMRLRLELRAIGVVHRLKNGMGKLREEWERTHGEVDVSAYDDKQLMQMLRPKHISEKHWTELVVESGISPAIASTSFETVEGKDAIELVLGPKLDSMKGHAQQYATKAVQGLLEAYDHLNDGGLWCPGQSDFGQLKPNTPRLDEGKPIKYESPLGVSLGVMLPDGPGINWDEIKKDTSVPLGITEGKKKAASSSSRGLNTIALAGMNGALLKGDLRPDLKEFDWEGRKVRLILDKDPSHKLKTLRDAARELYKLGAVLEYYGADVAIGTIPGKLTEKVGLDDHFVKGRGLEDLKWQSVSDFVEKSPYLTKKYRKHHEVRIEKGLTAKNNPTPKNRRQGEKDGNEFEL